MGLYTEVLFPEKNVRFIAINDGVDSEKGDNDFTPFRNIINEWYAKDTSKKIRAVMKSKGQEMCIRDRYSLCNVNTNFFIALLHRACRYLPQPLDRFLKCGTFPNLML